MSFQNIKNEIYSVGVSHRSATKNIHGYISSKVSKVLVGFCSYCNIKKTMTVFDNNVVSKCLSFFFKNSKKNGKKRLNASKKMAKKYIKVPKASLGHYIKRC